MSAVRSRTRARTAAVAAASLVAAGFALVTTAPAAVADVSSKNITPYSQDWSNGNLITTNNDWSGVTGVQGYATTSGTATGTDPQTVLADTTAAQTQVFANAAVTTTSGGVSEINGNTIAFQGSNGAPVAVVAFHLDLSGKTGTTFSYDAKDLDTSGDDALQQVAVQYRVGTSGAYTNIASGFIADATTASSATQVTHRDVSLPAAVNNQGDVFVRVLTVNAPNNDELVGIDNISVTSGAGPAALSLANPGPQTGITGAAVAGPTLNASGGSLPYTFSGSGFPTGVTLNPNGTWSGSYTAAGAFNSSVTVTDGASATDTKLFTWTITDPAAPTPIANIQGTGTASPFATQTKTTQGVVTASYPTGGYGGFYIQTPGADTANASDAIFVFGGANLTTFPTVGQSVSVTGVVTEFGTAPNTLTEIVVPNNTAVTTIGSLGVVTPKSVVPGTDCALGSCPATAAAINALREASEGELFQPNGDYTVTDVYDGSAYNGGVSTSSEYRGEIGLAAESDVPLMTPTEVFEAQTQGITDTTNYNNAHRMILDDASSTSYWNTSNSAAGQNSPLSWLSPTHTVRVGADVTFPAPVVLEWRNDLWKLQPQSQVIGAPTAGEDPQFAQDRPATPANVGGDLKLATFNVLNYFTTLGAAYGGCTSFTDKNSNPIAVNSCPGNGPRGAWNAVNFNRQQEKIVNAINTMDADIVSLEEIENSRKVDGVDRDEAVSALVDALNTAAGTTRWDYVASPADADLPTVAEEDVIRTAFIYDPSTVELVGDSQVLVGAEAFNNAREPFAQAFKATGSDDADGFGVIVNHFKSKGSGANDGTGQGLANPDRVAQAIALNTFANDFADDAGVEAVFLTGDFNAYSKEDPVRELEDEDWVNLESTDDSEEKSYSFDGASGSLDHVFANPAADAMVSGVDVWEINSNEPLYYQYSRYNYVTPLLYTSGPFAASDHNPEVIGINVPDVAKIATTTTADNATVGEGSDASIHVSVDPNTGSGTPSGNVTLSIGGNNVGSGTLSGGEATITADTDALADGTYTVTATYDGDSAYDGSSGDATLTVTIVTTDIQILGTNDFHGRIQNDSASAAAGAAVLAGAVKSLRAQNANTVFAAAGDLIGASTFESFIAKDKPTIDALNSAGLDVSAAGNHEFDQGYDDLVNRVMQPYNASTNPYGGANWDYIAANVEFVDTDDPALDRVWTKTMNGVKVGFVGAVTEDLPTLVNPGGISQIEVTDIVDATNAAANQLKANGADVIVLLVHEGAPGTDCNTMATQSNAFADIINGVNTKVDAIVSGHTHLEYNCSFEVPGWSGRPVTKRPVVSAGQYGAALNKLVFTVDKASGDVLGLTQAVLKLKSCTSSTACTNYTPDGPTATIVQNAVANADVLGAEEVGRVAEPFKRAYFSNGTSENRGGESTLGNLVAEVQRWVTDTPTTGNAQIAFMNPGGLRTDILGEPDANTGLKVTYKQAANVQPFANTLVNMDLTGAQIKSALEQQWRTETRPFLKLGVSQGFKYTYDPQASPGNRIKQMFLKGVPIEAGTTYSVTVNSFLANGGDGFSALAGGTGKQDTGKVDLQAMVDYLTAFANRTAGDPPLTVDYAQRSVGVHFPTGAPTSYSPGDHVVFDVSSFSMTNASDLKDAAVTVQVGGNTVGTATLDNTPQAGTAGGFDEVGKASVDIVLPVIAPGTRQVRLVGTSTGTLVTVPIEVGKAGSTVVGEDTSAAINTAVKLAAAVTGDAGRRSGTVDFFEGTTSLGSATLTLQGKASLTLPAGTLTVGDHTIKAVYSGDGAYLGSEDEFTVTVTKATTIVSATSPTAVYGKTATVRVTVATAPAWPVSGTVTLVEGSTVVATATVSGKITNVPVTGLSAGVHNLAVYFTGNDEVAPGFAFPTVTITKAASKTVAKVNPASPRAGKPVTVSGTVTGAGAPASGDVEIAVDGTTQTVTLDSAGTFSLSFPGGFTPAGSLDLVVTYLGNANLETSSVTKTITVRP